MLNISKVSQLTDLQSDVLRKRAERGHCPRSKEFLASQGEEEAGLLSYEDWGSNEPGFIYEIFVLPLFRQQGVGKVLLAYAENYAVQLGCRSIRLKPYALDEMIDQSRLIGWYEKAGYRRLQNDEEHMVKSLHAQGAA